MKRLICLLYVTIFLLNSIAFTAFAQSKGIATASASDSFGDYIPENAVDGDINTRWALRSATGWIAFDVGDVTSVDTVEITQLSDSIISLDVLYSEDGNNWEKATSYEMESTSNFNAFYTTVIGFGCVDARYIKISVTDAGKSSYINICELKAYYSGQKEKKAEITDFDTEYLPEDILFDPRIDEIRTVIDLGIMLLTDNNEFNPDESISRAELAYAAYIMRGGANIKECIISDVHTEHKYHKAIQYAVNSGIMSIDTYARFNPDGACDTDMVCRVISAVIGYDRIARENGGYPEGYRNIAAQNGLFKGMHGLDMNRANAAVMFANALEVEVMVDKLMIGAGEIFRDGSDLLKSGMNLMKVSGQVKAVGDKSVSVNVSAGDGKIKIDDIAYLCDDMYVEDYLGYAIEGYCTDEDEPRLVSLRLQKKNKVSRIFEEDMKPGNNVFSLDYYKKESTVLKNIEFSRNVYAVYNGYPIAFDYNIFKESSFSNGYIDALDIDSDRTIDVVFIHQYTPYIVSSVLDSLGKIYCMDDTVIELSDYESYNIVKNGQKSSLEEILKENVISLFEDRNREHVKIVVGEDLARGGVSSIREEYVTIEDTEYEIGKRLLKDFENGSKQAPVLGANVIAYIDARGLVFDFKNDNANRKNMYGYLISALKPDYSDIENYGKLRLYTENGMFEVFELAKKVHINNVQRLPEDVFTDPRIYNSNGTVPQLIKYSFNAEGKIRRIEIAKRKSTFGEVVDQSGLTDAEKLILSSRIQDERSKLDDETFTVNAQGVKRKVRNGNMSFGSAYFYDGNTVIFKVPVNIDDVKKVDYYAVWNKDIMAGKSNTECVFSTYDENEFLVAGAVLIHDGSANNEKPDDNSFVLALDNVKDVYNEIECEIQTVYSGLVKGTEKKFTSSTDNIKNLMKDVVKGDIIRFAADSNSRFYGVERAFSYQYLKDDLRDDLKMNLSVRPKPYDGFDYHIGDDSLGYEQICGTVVKVDDDRALIKTSAGGVENECVIVYRDSTVVTAYEVDGKYMTAKAASKNSIQLGCRIYARCEYGNLREVVVYHET